MSVTLAKVTDRFAPRGVTTQLSAYEEACRLEIIAPNLASLTEYTEALYANDHEALRTVFAILAY